MRHLTKHAFKWFHCCLVPVWLCASGAASADGSDVRLLADNTFELQGAKVALFGVSVPRATEKCAVDGKPWPCGAAATLRLNKLIKNSSLSCIPVLELDSVSLVSCSASDSDLGRQLVEEGMALAVTDDSIYAEAESRAKKNQLGIWRGEFEPPDAWRQYSDSTLNPYLDLMCSVCAARKQ